MTACAGVVDCRRARCANRHNPGLLPHQRTRVDHRTRFLQLALQAQALRFGQFTLKSGRVSPYFFNAGQFQTGMALAQLAACYADAVDAAGVRFDLLFGPAYKGIPLATAVACEYARRGRDQPLAFNRKEAKTHGEGGQLIGAPLAGRRVLIVDDVITAGTAVSQALACIADAGGIAAGIAVALDRQETLQPEGDRRSAADVIAQKHAVPVIAIATLDDVLHAAQNDPALTIHSQALGEYRQRYGTGAAP